MTVEELRRWGREQLLGLAALGEPSQVEISTLQLEVDLLLCHTLECDMTKLLISRSRDLTVHEQDRFGSFVLRRQLSEPVAYIRGFKEFYGIEFLVNSSVLIPRPETELVVELALEEFKSQLANESLTNYLLVDVGTGSGAIISSILSELHGRCGQSLIESGLNIAVDMSADALCLARENAGRLGLEQFITFEISDLLSELHLETQGVNIFVANLPYIPETQALSRDVENYEPQIALRGGATGIETIVRLLNELATSGLDQYVAFLEIGDNQRLLLEPLLEEMPISTYQFHRDLRGMDRVLEVRCADE